MQAGSDLGRVAGEQGIKQGRMQGGAEAERESIRHRGQREAGI